ncbi:MAG TPA: hypothetical protein VH598_11155, partial [Verrucomicrobiae bacterium]|nr:hypothetical protein [Verrucomicrobiae bacterium]
MKLIPSIRHRFRIFTAIWIVCGFCHFSSAAVYNLKIVTDASPDYSDMPSLIHSATSRWETPEEKCWALFYWNHIARRQTAPMMLHGLALADPIRQFNDYGYTMCSTVSGINCSLWDALGFKTRYWDITQHTVPEVEYAGAWHVYDNSMSAIYTLCDGRTIAGVADIGKPGACAASGWKTEPGHVAKYHCLTATSPNGFLTGADTMRSLDEESRCFNPNGLKERPYYRDWDRGHRYILNLRENESYTRYYHSLGKTAGYFVPNNGKDPEEANQRYHLRGNGVRLFKPALTPASLSGEAHQLLNAAALDPAGVAPIQVGQPGEIIFKIEGANVITSLKIRARLFQRTAADLNQIAISTVNGMQWREVWRNDKTGETPLDLNLVEEVNGAYEVLVKVTLLGRAAAADSQLKHIEFETVTMLNSKTQPNLLLGKNTIYVGTGDQTESIVLWPDLRGKNYKPYVVEERNVRTAAEHPGYMGVLCGAKPGEEAHVVFKVDAPRDITRLQYGGRFYNRAPHSHINLLHSFDGGKTWRESYSLTNTAQPWDVIHYETVDAVPPGARSVLFKYSLTSPAAGFDACSLYAVRMEVNHLPVAPGFKPLEVTFNWSERQTDYSLIERSHVELVASLPHRFTIDVGGADHPIVNWLRVNSQGVLPDSKYGYSDGRDAGGEKFVPRWLTVGKNLAEGKPYTVSIPSKQEWGAGDPDGKKLTDGVVGPPYPGGPAPSYALCWEKGERPEITVDLGRPESCAAFRIQLGAGWPWWD